MIRTISTGFVCAVLGTATAASPRESASFADVPSVARAGSSENATRTVFLAGGYDVGHLHVSATLASPAGGSSASDARILVTAPTGRTFTVQPSRAGVFSGSIAIDPPIDRVVQPAEPASGLWVFEFFEARDDAAGADAVWQNVAITFDDAPPPPPPGDPAAAEDLGEIVPGTTIVDLEPDLAVFPTIKWYRFQLTSAAAESSRIFLDLDSNDTEFGSPTDPSTDTEIALFSAAGDLIAQDDDDGAGLASLLSFGAVSARAGGAQSQDGSLSPGTYYLCVAPFNATFAAGFSVSTTGTAFPARIHVRVASGFASPPSPPSAIELGTLFPGELLPPPQFLSAGQVLWYHLTLPVDASSALSTFLDFDTEGSVLTPSSDTMIGLYDETGARIAFDDDDGSGLLSQLTFGGASTTPAAGGGLYDGRDGLLAAGGYYLAVTAFGNTAFGPAGWSVYTEHSRSGTAAVRLHTNIGVPPCPADFNNDGFIDFFDYDDYVNCFESGVCPDGRSADFNGDDFVDFFDYDEYVAAFEVGC